jgi:hypothetical protein
MNLLEQTNILNKNKQINKRINQALQVAFIVAYLDGYFVNETVG